MTILGAILLVITALLYAGAVGLITSINSSDPAGNGLTQSFAFLTTIALWIFLGALLLLAATKGEMPGWAAGAACVLVPASGAAAIAAVGLLKDSFYHAKWPLVIPALAPALMMAFALWAYFPGLRNALPALGVSAIVWGSLLILSLAPWPTVAHRARHGKADRAQADAAWKAGEPARAETARQKNLVEFRALTPASELRDWLLFVAPSNELRDQALAAIRQLARRQADAEAMLRQGSFFDWEDLPLLDLEVTPTVGEAARKFLREKTQALQPHRPESPPQFRFVADQVESCPAIFEWLVNNRCACAAELDALVATVRIYHAEPKREEFLATLTRIRAAMTRD